MTILERLRAATGPDYELDIAIFKFQHPEYADYVKGRGGLVHVCDGSDQRVLSDVRPDNYTASIDTALLLVERMLPGCGYTVTRGRFSLDEPLFSAQICRSDLIPDDAGPEPYGFPSGHNSPALAILTALFAALEAKERT